MPGQPSDICSLVQLGHRLNRRRPSHHRTLVLLVVVATIAFFDALTRHIAVTASSGSRVLMRLFVPPV
jgi:hypothetical protein